MTKVICAMFLVGMLAAPLRGQKPPAQDDTARALIKMCTDMDNEDKTRKALIAGDPTPVFGEGFCVGYMRANMAMSLTFKFLLKTTLVAPALSKVFFCLPEEVDVDQLRRVFLKYMKDHPEKLHEYYDLMVRQAFIAAFPCKANQ